MFSYLNFFISFLILLSKGLNLKFKNNFYSIILTSFVIAYTTQGFISLGIISIGYSKFPIIIFSSLFLFLIILFDKSSTKKLSLFKNFISGEINFIKKDTNKKYNLIIFVILILMNLIVISSIGPINHPDALDYHVGYPYQYWLRGEFFIDGGFHQAVLGIGDYANLPFIQEKNIWLIRTLQIINLPIIVLFLLRKSKKKILVLIFLSCPVFIQWATIGKPLFLVESACAVNFIIWNENKDLFSRRLLLFCILSAISVKISATIICLPIIIELFQDFINKNNINKFTNNFKNIIFDPYTLFAFLKLISILISREFIIGNFAFPLFTEILNKNNSLLINFANDLSNYQRDGFFPINIFIPVSFSDLSSSIGPTILVIICTIFFIFVKNKKIFNFNELKIALTQIILLVLFCQGRGDYYACPIILLTYSSQVINQFISKNLLKFFKNTINILLLFQILFLTLFLFISTMQSIYSALDYENSIRKISYGYETSLEINKNLDGNIFHNIGRNVRFYYPKKYIDRDKFNKCLIGDTQENCLKKFKINQIIAPLNYLKNKNNFQCKTKLLNKGSRSPINRKKEIFEICERL